MAPNDFGMPPGVAAPGRKPKTSIYTVMIIMSLVALLVGMLFLYLEIRRFGGFGTVRGRVAAVETADSMGIELAGHEVPACLLAV